MSEQPEICVVHLARAVNGIEPFRAFVESYRQNDGGVEHDLTILFKGFADEGETTAYRELLEVAPARSIRCLHVPDVGFDIEPYCSAARALDHAFLCYLNSFSRVLDRDWLAKLRAAFERPTTGVASATGSYLSWRDICAEQLRQARSRPEPDGARGPLKLARLRLRVLWYRMNFPPFPNRFVRTNAFLIRGDVMRRIRHRPIRTKLHAYLFESGHNSLTAQVMRIGLEPVVVGRDGRTYAKEEWHLSDTFMQGDQSNLLVADNQTERYRRADAQTRREFCHNSWGDLARPLAPSVAALGTLD